MKPTIKTAADIRPAMEYLLTLAETNGVNAPAISSSKFRDYGKIMRAIWEKTGAVPVGYIQDSILNYRFVFGWGDDPAGIVTRVQVTNKDKLSVDKFAISTPYIKKEIGLPMTILSGDADSMVRIIKTHGSKFIQPVSNTDMYPTAYPAINKTIRDLFLGGSPAWLPEISSTARYQLYKRLTGEANDSTEIDRWIKESSIKIKRDIEADRKSHLIKQGFSKKALVIHKAPYYCDNPIHVAEVSFVGGTPVVLSERRVGSIDDLTDYPHVIGVNNLCKLNGAVDVFSSKLELSNDYSREFNLFSLDFDSMVIESKKKKSGVNKERLFDDTRHIVFPAEFVELNEVPATQPQASESSLSVLEF
jgi:hypothetical protein